MYFSRLQLGQYPFPFDLGCGLLAFDLLGGHARRSRLALEGCLSGGFELLFESRDLLAVLPQLHVKVVVLYHGSVISQPASACRRLDRSTATNRRNPPTDPEPTAPHILSY